jgi:lipopolysaccharide biosynthesis regulator YciM
MQVEPIWLVALPIVFGVGWLASRWDKRLELAEDEAEQSQKQKSTFKGLNLLLNEQPDKAIDALVEVAQLDPETTELHFALGSLFRRRGETERAIRVHQHLAGRQDISQNDRDHAAYELGRDFLRAGLLDRAESTLNRVGQSKYSTPAKVALLEMYQIEKDWRKAIVAAAELQSLDGVSHQHQIAHFHCELAQEALRRKDLTNAQLDLEHALQSVPFHTRAIMLKGELLVAQQRPKEAVEVWKEIEQRHPMYLPLVADRWMAAHAELGQEKAGLELLKKNLQQQASGELLDIVFKHVLRLEGAEAASHLMAQVMRYSPSLTAMAKRLEAQLSIAKEGSDEEGVLDIKASLDLLKQKTGSLARYTCGSCGFRARRFYWQCPGCNNWDAYSPRRSEGVAPSGPSM